jgi:hypothetical protein
MSAEMHLFALEPKTMPCKPMFKRLAGHQNKMAIKMATLWYLSCVGKA